MGEGFTSALPFRFNPKVALNPNSYARKPEHKIPPTNPRHDKDDLQEHEATDLQEAGCLPKTLLSQWENFNLAALHIL